MTAGPAPGRESAGDRDAAARPLADAIVVAAGASRRMGGVDKLWAQVGGRPLLAWTIDAIAAAPSVERIVVVAGADRIADVERASWGAGKVAAVVAGGGRRQESVAAGFAAVGALPGADDDRIVLVHDGARPLVRVELVDAVARAAREHGAAIPVLPVAETLKQVEDGIVVATLGRDAIATAQTPQGVRAGTFRAALARFPVDAADTFTDEAALLEACRIAVHAIHGDPGNIKVTVADDLRRAETLLVGGSATRIGLGRDSHPFGPGEPLILGGVEFAGAPRLHGHSDGDVVLHAVADALLGAAGLGDLGRLFPADARTPRGIASGALLADVVRRVHEAGVAPLAVDLTIVGARPRLGERLDAIRDAVASAVGLPADRVSVKASSGNLGGMEGAGRGVSAQVVVLAGTGR